MDDNTMTCDFCGEAYGKYSGKAYECDRCGKIFCRECFSATFGLDALCDMLAEHDYMYCPDCYNG